MRKSLAILLLGLCLPFAAMAQVKGDTAPPVFRDGFEEARFRALTHELRCVMCQNQSLADSNAEIARDHPDARQHHVDGKRLQGLQHCHEADEFTLPHREGLGGGGGSHAGR